MTITEMARRMAELGQREQALDAYALSLRDGTLEPVAQLEAAAYILYAGGDYKISYTVCQKLYNEGHHRREIWDMLTTAFYTPNIRTLKNRYERNCKALLKYPYLFRRDFPAFEDLPVQFFPYDEHHGYIPYDRAADRFGGYVNTRQTVISRNFFKDLEKPLLAADVFSQYELEYLRDNVRKSEDVGRENHIYLHYTKWEMFCAWLQVLNIKPLLREKKFVFLMGDDIARYPIDFQAEYGVDYSAFPVQPIRIQDVSRLIWHTQLSSHNGGDFFNEIFDAHPNLIATPSIMLDSMEESVQTVREALQKAKNIWEAGQLVPELLPSVLTELYWKKNRTDKDILVAIFLSATKKEEQKRAPWMDESARIAPALFFQPHFANIVYEISVDSKNRTMLYAKTYEKIRTSSLFRDFKYIKTFTPMRRFTTSHGATVRFMHRTSDSAWEKENVGRIIPDAVSERILNRSFMIDWQDRLFADSVLVRFEDGKLNPKATFTALAAFLDLPYTESMTYCSLFNERDPESLEGNDLGFSPAAIYRNYDEYANDAERCYIEYFLRDAYAYYGYDFLYYHGEEITEERLQELVDGFTTMDKYIRETWKRGFSVPLHKELEGKEYTEEEIEKSLQETLEKQMADFRDNRIKNGKAMMQRNLYFVNKNGQPLRMMPKLALDPALLEQPLYH